MKEETGRKADMRAMRSLVNNFNASRDTFLDCRRLKRCVRRIKDLTGSSEQAVIVKMLWYAYENNPELADIRSAIEEGEDGR